MLISIPTHSTQSPEEVVQHVYTVQHSFYNNKNIIIIITIFTALGCKGTRGLKAKRKMLKLLE